MLTSNRVWSFLLGLIFLLSQAAAALEVNLTEYTPYIDVKVNGENVRIQRSQDTNRTLSGLFSKTSRPCPPFCIHPMQASKGVETVGEVEVFDFISGPLKRGSGVLVDARTPQWFSKQTIPGAVNIPWTLMAKADPNDQNFVKVMQSLGVKPRSGETSLLDTMKGMFGAKVDTGDWDFSEAKELCLFCNGPWCDQSPRAIKGLIGIGYPASKLRYYRGGMQMWHSFSLTVIPGGS